MCAPVLEPELTESPGMIVRKRATKQRLKVLDSSEEVQAARRLSKQVSDKENFVVEISKTK